MTLTPRQIEVIRLISRGFIDKQIADALGVSTRTIHAHVCAILFRLKSKTKAQAVFKFYLKEKK